MVTRSRKPVRVPSSVSELFGPRDFTVVAEQEILGQRLNLFFGEKLVDFLFELDEDKRFFAVIGPEHLDLPEGHRALAFLDICAVIGLAYPAFFAVIGLLALLIYVENLPRWTSSWTTWT